MKKLLFIFGTRPEAIKMAPVINEAHKFTDIHSVVCITAQHREMLDKVLNLFNIVPDYDLNLIQENQSLFEITSKVITSLEAVLEEVRPDWVLVQGDTTSSMAASLSAFYKKIRVGHIEAGLRSHNNLSPFPEEVNRRITSVIANYHFAPTEMASMALLSEGVSEENISITGNTVIDALLYLKKQIIQISVKIPPALKDFIKAGRMILVTGHRRESFGSAFENICLAIKELSENNDDLCIVYPVHLNPNVRRPVNKILKGLKRVHLIEPLDYASFVWMMNSSYLILTDSGGIQEEAPSLGKPVVVMRDVTERPEGIKSGCSVLAGTRRDGIVKTVQKLLGEDSEYMKMARAANPYGDGQAASRIISILREF